MRREQVSSQNEYSVVPKIGACGVFFICNMDISQYQSSIFKSKTILTPSIQYFKQAIVGIRQNIIMEIHDSAAVYPQQQAPSSVASEQLINIGEQPDIFHEQKKEFQCKSLRKILNSMHYQIIITIVTIFILFADDIRVLGFQKRHDEAFDYVQLTVMGLFLVELVLSSISIEGYVLSFFFWLDMLSSCSILMDVGLFTNAVFSIDGEVSSNISIIAKQAKTSRVALRAVRVVKLLRLIRVVKLYKSAVRASEIKQNLKKDKMKKGKLKSSSEKVATRAMPNSFGQNIQIQNQTIQHLAPVAKTKKTIMESQVITQDETIAKVEEIYQMQIDSKLIKQSRVSQMLSDSTIKKVMIVVLLIQFCIPLFDPTVYIEASHSMDFFVSNLKSLLNDPTTSTDDIIALTNEVVTEHLSLTTPLVYFSTPFQQIIQYKDEIYDDLRLSDTIASTQTVDGAFIMSVRAGLNDDPTTDNVTIIAVLNGKYLSNLSAYFSIATTIFICVVVGVLLHYFTKDIHDLVIQPIQQMMEEVQRIAKNPTDANLMENTIKEDDQYQTAIVHNAILKIGGLLSLVFGSAGAEIIGTNMMKGGDMNPLIGGKKKCAIFGFCDIRNFTDATEVLQEDIMIFVNQIGEIVHSAVYRYGGSANKNIGDAFLLVWKIPQDKYAIDKSNRINWINLRYVSILSDFSLLSFIKIIVKINKQPKILRYSKDMRLIQRLGKNYQVKMGFGLHVGWAIEGAIGSEYKIDASYLSPNVNMASRLEAATKQYGVPILISSYLYDLFTNEMKQFCRAIDKVTVKGSNQPVGFYTVDLDLANISPPSDKQQKYRGQQVPDIEFKKSWNMQYLQQLIDSYDAYTFIEQKKQLREVLMINVHLHDFRSQFQLGFENYLGGDWGKALAHFEMALKYKKDDGPTVTLMNYITGNMKNGTSPKSWKHYRELTQK